ncbi:MAG: ABC transporter substrate-binding protein, partial [Acidobacteriota bacterium]
MRLKAIRAGGWLLLALTLQVVACRRPPSPAESLTLNAYLSTEPASLNFISQNDRSTESIGRLVCDTLVGFDRDVRLVPRLAASWDVSPDGRQVVFHLRSGVKWHDGAPFTAGDVAFSLAKVLDPASLAAGRRVYFET